MYIGPEGRNLRANLSFHVPLGRHRRRQAPFRPSRLMATWHNHSRPPGDREWRPAHLCLITGPVASSTFVGGKKERLAAAVLLALFAPAVPAWIG